ncbi:MAG: hypothetical protein ACFFDH_02300 [Promethearchaeota archaeon]
MDVNLKKIPNRANNVSQKTNRNIEKLLLNSSYTSNNFNKIPPIIGCLIADRYGNTLMVFEYDLKDRNNYGPIKSYLTENESSFLEIDLISMYFSSLKTFANQTNIQNLSNLEIHGSNIKVLIFFLFDNFMIILFLNSNTELNIKEKTLIVDYFENMISRFEFEFKYFNTAKSRKIFQLLEKRGNIWLKKLNRNYLMNFKHSYLRKHEIIEEIRIKITPIIENVLNEYLENIQDNIINNISKEIQNQIQDKLFNFKSNIQSVSIKND